MKKTYFFLLVMVCTTLAVFAQPEGKKGGHAQKGEKRAEMRAYFESTIYPFLKREHDQLDAALSKSDLAELTPLRAEAQNIQDKMRDLKKTVHAAVKEQNLTREQVKQQFAAQFQGIKTAREAIINKVQPIVQRNQAALDKALQSIATQREEWKQHFQQTHPDKPKCDKPNNNTTDTDNPNPREHKPHHHLLLTSKPAAFLLWDGSMPSDDFDKNTTLEDNNELFNDDAPSLQQNYPNPTLGNTTVEFRLPKTTANTTLTVRNISGQVVKTFNYPNLEKGTHAIDLHLDGIGKGTYNYTIQTSEGYTETKQLLVQ
jgi:hypothetical protein